MTHDQWLAYFGQPLKGVELVAFRTGWIAATERDAKAIENRLAEHASELSADAVDFANEMIDLIRNQEPT